MVDVDVDVDVDVEVDVDHDTRHSCYTGRTEETVESPKAQHHGACRDTVGRPAAPEGPPRRAGRDHPVHEY